MGVVVSSGGRWSPVGVGGLQFQSGGFGEQKYSLSLLGIEMHFFGRPPGSLVTAPTD